MKTKPSSVEEIRKQTKNLIDAHKKSIQDFHENHFPHLFEREGRMIDWTPEAIEAAHRAMFQEPYDGTTAAMIGAGLDAAAAAQGIKDEEITRLREENARLRSILAAKVRPPFDDDLAGEPYAAKDRQPEPGGLGRIGQVEGGGEDSGA